MKGDDMQGSSTGVMIALLPITDDWCKIDYPHMTLVYAGSTDDLEQTVFNELAKDAAMLAQLTPPLTLRVTGVEQFGKNTPEDPLVDVFRLQPSPQLVAMRRTVEHWNASEFPFQPHTTIGPAGALLDYKPSHLAFDRISVGWGSEYLTFNLSNRRM